MNKIVKYLAERNVEMASPLRELYSATGFGTSIYILDPDQYMIELKANILNTRGKPLQRRRWAA